MPDVLVVDDDDNLRRSLAFALSCEGYEVREAENGTVALRKAGESRPDLVVLDLMMPGIDGVAVCRRLRETSSVPVLMLTARDAVKDRVSGLDAGADDYLVKPFALEELLARVRALLRRRGEEAISEYVYDDLVLDEKAHEVRRGDRLVELAPREFELLRMLIANPETVLTRAALLGSLWRYPPQSRVLDVYVGYLRQKLEAASEPRLVHTVRGVGYVLRRERR